MNARVATTSAYASSSSSSSGAASSSDNVWAAGIWGGTTAAAGPARALHTAARPALTGTVAAEVATFACALGFFANMERTSAFVVATVNARVATTSGYASSSSSTSVAAYASSSPASSEEDAWDDATPASAGSSVKSSSGTVSPAKSGRVWCSARLSKLVSHHSSSGGNIGLPSGRLKGGFAAPRTDALSASSIQKSSAWTTVPACGCGIKMSRCPNTFIGVLDLASPLVGHPAYIHTYIHTGHTGSA